MFSNPYISQTSTITLNIEEQFFAGKSWIPTTAKTITHGVAEPEHFNYSSITLQ